MSLSNTFETRTLQWLLTTAAVTRPTQWYLGLSSADPLDDASGDTPPVGAAYTRVSATFAVANDQATNTGVLEFPEATANWGVMTHGTVWDAPTGGNMIASGLLRDSNGDPASVTVNNGQIVRIPIGAFAISSD